VLVYSIKKIENLLKKKKEEGGGEMDTDL